jgi:hypothetical protein
MTHNHPESIFTESDGVESIWIVTCTEGCRDLTAECEDLGLKATGADVEKLQAAAQAVRDEF